MQQQQCLMSMDELPTDEIDTTKHVYLYITKTIEGK